MMIRPRITNISYNIPYTIYIVLSLHMYICILYTEFNSFYVIFIVLQVTSKHATGSKHAKSTWTHANEHVNVYNKKPKKYKNTKIFPYLLFFLVRRVCNRSKYNFHPIPFVTYDFNDFALIVYNIYIIIIKFNYNYNI